MCRGTSPLSSLSVIASTDWNEWVGIGTLALAGVTLLLAVVSAVSVRVAARTAADTKKLAQTAEDEVRKIGEQIDLQRDEVAAIQAQAEATARQVASAQTALDAAVRPVMVDVPAGSEGTDLVIYDPELGGFTANSQAEVALPSSMVEVVPRGDEKMLYVSVPFRNAGPGIAIATVRPVLTWDETGDSHIGRLTQAVVPPGERTRARFRLRTFERDDPNKDLRQVRASLAILGTGGGGFGAFHVDVEYLNVRGTERFRSRVDIAQVEEAGQWVYRVLRFHLFEGDAELPAVSSEIAAP